MNNARKFEFVKLWVEFENEFDCENDWRKYEKFRWFREISCVNSIERFAIVDLIEKSSTNSMIDQEFRWLCKIDCSIIERIIDSMIDKRFDQFCWIDCAIIEKSSACSVIDKKTIIEKLSTDSMIDRFCEADCAIDRNFV